MRTYQTFIVLCTSLLLFYGCSTEQPNEEQSHVIYLDEIDSRKLPYMFDLVDVKTAASYKAEDIDGDGSDEFILWENKPIDSQENSYLLLERFQKNKTIKHIPLDGFVRLPFFGDWDQDGTTELFMSLTGRDTSWLYIIDHQGDVICEHAAGIRPQGVTGNWDCQVTPDHLIDINDDGHLDLVYHLQTGFAYQPRDIVAYDIYNRQVIWPWPTGLYITKTILHDIDGDGRKELIIGSNSPANSEGYKAGNPIVNSTDDSATRIDVLSLDGSLKKGMVLGGDLAEMDFVLYDFDDDGDLDVVFSFSSHNENKESGYVAVWDYEDNRPINKRLVEKETNGNMMLLPGTNGEGEEVILGWDDGTIEILGPGLELRVSKQFPGLSYQKFRPMDVNSDGRQEIILSGAYRDRSASLVLDRDLQVIALHDKDLNIDQIVDPGYGEKKLLLGSGVLDIKSITQLLEIKRQIRLPFTIPWAGLLAGVIIGAGMFMVRNSVNKTSAQAETRRKILAACGVPALIIDSKGRIIQINQRACLLADVLPEDVKGSPFASAFNDAAWQKLREIVDYALSGSETAVTDEISITTGSTQSDILLSVNPMQLGPRHSGRLILLFDVTDLAQSKRVVAWASMAQKLAHEIKTPLSTVMLSTQHLQMECEEDAGMQKKLNKYIQRIITQVSRLQKLTDSFLKFSRIEAPRCEPLDVNKLVQDWLTENKFKLGSSVKVDLQLEENLPAVSGDQQQLTIVIQNLIENSLKAMDGRGVLTIATRLVQSLHSKSGDIPGTGVQVEISDTGKGMSSEELEKLFMPFFSKAAGGTGLGLVITKKIIDDHKGIISVESEHGIGTRVTVTIPA